MNLTFNEFERSVSSLMKLTRSELITDYNDILIISDWQEPAEKVEAKLKKALSALKRKYAKLAEKRRSKDFPNGYSSADEVDEYDEEKETLLTKLCDTPFNFQPISEETVQLLVKGVSEIIVVDGKNVVTGKKLQCLTALDISILKRLGIISVPKEIDKAEKKDKK